MDIVEWVYTLIIGIIGIGIAWMLSQEFCKIEPTACNSFLFIVIAAVIGLAIALKYGLVSK